MRARLTTTAARHWFYLLVPLAAAMSLALCTSIEWRAEARYVEATTLFDWCVFLPAMYAFCYRRTLAPGALAVRTVAMMGGGLWVAALIVPDAHERLIGAMSWLRYPALAVAMICETVVLVALLKATFGRASEPDLVGRFGVPPMVAKAMLAEARFWQGLWRKMRGR